MLQWLAINVGREQLFWEILNYFWSQCKTCLLWTSILLLDITINGLPSVQTLWNSVSRWRSGIGRGWSAGVRRHYMWNRIAPICSARSCNYQGRFRLGYLHSLRYVEISFSYSCQAWRKSRDLGRKMINGSPRYLLSSLSQTSECLSTPRKVFGSWKKDQSWGEVTQVWVEWPAITKCLFYYYPLESPDMQNDRPIRSQRRDTVWTVPVVGQCWI